MNATMKWFLAFGALAVLTIVCLATQIRTEQISTGDEWLSWTSTERTTYVNGFIDGYLQGRYVACNVADDLFEVDKPHHPGDETHPSDFPASRCIARVDVYSRQRLTNASPYDFRAYTNVITDFYTKHPEYRNIPFPYLMQFLTDKRYKTANELYEMAHKGELRTTF